MLFHSHIFLLVFLPLTLAGWFWFNRRGLEKPAQWYLVGMSMWFCGWFHVGSLWTAAASALIGYFFCVLLTRCRRKKTVLAAGCLFHLGMLGYFKYCNFFLENLSYLTGRPFGAMQILIPAGISFYSFSQIGYLAGLYRGQRKCCSFLDYLTFFFYFPKLLQGPILLGEEFLPQLHDPDRRKFSRGAFAAGCRRFTKGLAKKTLLADTLALAVDYGYGNVALLDGPGALFLAVGYMLQLYFDFSGYCDMAGGVSRMMGFSLAENFDRPFLSLSVREFWRRWHITLGRFLSRYVYFPLGGNRKGLWRTLLNTMAVFFLSGLWHGASWNFVLWGLLHGVAVCCGTLWDWWGKKRQSGRPRPGLPVWARRSATFLTVCLTFVFFRAENMGQALAVFRALFSVRAGGFLSRMAVSITIPELYALQKLLSMKAPRLLTPVLLGMVLAFVCACLLAVLIDWKGVGGRPPEGWTAKGKALAGKLSPFLWGALFAWAFLSITGETSYLYFSF